MPKMERAIGRVVESIQAIVELQADSEQSFAKTAEAIEEHAAIQGATDDLSEFVAWFHGFIDGE